MLFLAPALLVGLSALAIPVFIHLVQRERKQVVPFPSLMFVRRIPYQSVRRRRIRHWLLLMLRLGAILLVVLAFARPYFQRGALAAAVTASGGREVAILLDDSASMAYGDHWTHARAAARKVVDELGAADRATLVLFAATAEESVRSTDNRARLVAAINAARPGSSATRYSPALKLAMSVLAKSSLQRREAVLISDFQKSGWRGTEDVRFPEGTLLTPISVASSDAVNVSVPSVSLARAPFSGKERITVTAAIRNSGAAPASNLPVSLQIGDHVIETISASTSANASAPVTFAPFTLATPGLTCLVHAGSDAMPADNTFRFVLAPSSTVSVLLVDGESSGSSVYLAKALEIGAAPRFQVDVVAQTRVTSAALDAHAVVVLNGTPAARISAAALARFVERGGGLLMLLGGEPASASTAGTSGDAGRATADDPLPAATPEGIDSSDAHVTTIGYVDYSHPIFEIFQGAHGGDFASARVYRHRTMTPRREDRVLSRFSDGGIALLERRLGNGRVIAWTSTFDDSWNDLALKPVFLPLVQQIARYVARYQEQVPWQSVGQAIDLDDVARTRGVDRAASATAGGGRASAASGHFVLTPSGRRIDSAADGKPLRFVELEEQGFYEIRGATPSGLPDAPPVTVAVNLDPAESDLSAIDPQELVAAVTGHAQPMATASAAPLTFEELERRQSIWRYLLWLGLAVLAAETVISNRLSAASTTGVAAAGNGFSVTRVSASRTDSPGTPSISTRTTPPDPVFEGRADVAR